MDIAITTLKAIFIGTVCFVAGFVCCSLLCKSACEDCSEAIRYLSDSLTWGAKKLEAIKDETTPVN